jgi:flagellar hook-length control protein FliK
MPSLPALISPSTIPASERSTDQATTRQAEARDAGARNTSSGKDSETPSGFEGFLAASSGSQSANPQQPAELGSSSLRGQSPLNVVNSAAKLTTISSTSEAAAMAPSTLPLGGGHSAISMMQGTPISQLPDAPDFLASANTAPQIPGEAQTGPNTSPNFALASSVSTPAMAPKSTASTPNMASANTAPQIFEEGQTGPNASPIPAPAEPVKTAAMDPKPGALNPNIAAQGLVAGELPATHAALANSNTNATAGGKSKSAGGSGKEASGAQTQTTNGSGNGVQKVAGLPASIVRETNLEAPPDTSTAASEEAATGAIERHDQHGTQRHEALLAARHSAGQTHGPRMDAAALAAFAARMAKRFNDGSTRFQLRLDPPELGKVDISVAISRDGKAQAKLAVERPEALIELQRHARALERVLSEQGFIVDEGALTFALANDPQGNPSGFSFGEPESDDGLNQALPKRAAERTIENTEPDAEVETVFGFSVVKPRRIDLTA